jgi:iron complex outermembrane receptor protein
MGNAAFACGVILFGLTLASAPAESQEMTSANTSPSAGDQLEEIVIQARLRDERLIDVPAAVTALSAASMADKGIESVRDIGQYVPGLNVADGVDDSTDRFFIRGIGTVTPTVGAEPSVPIYIDDIYTPSGIASNVDVFGFDRVEVLRGPQGTLYGRNSFGGAIKFYTKELSNDTSGYVTAGVGNNDGRDIKAEFATPIILDKLWIGGGAASITRDGYQTDPFNGGVRGWGEDKQIYKVKAQFDPIEPLRFTVAYDDTRSDAPAKQPKITEIGSPVFNTGLLAQYPGLVPNLGQSSTNPDVVDTSSHGNEQVYAHGLTWSGTWKITDGLSLKYLGSDRWLENIRIFDIDGSASPFLIVNEDFRLNGKTNEVQLNWATDKWNLVGGLFHYQEDTTARNGGPNGFYGFLDPHDIANVIIDGQGRPTTVDLQSFTPSVFSQQVQSTAIFANATYAITSQLDASAGLRWTEDNKATQGSQGSIIFANGSTTNLYSNSCFCVPPGATILATDYAPQLSGRRIFPELTPEFIVDYKPSTSQMVYGSYKRGFQAGTIYPAANVVPGAALSTAAQTVDAFELGSKGIYFDDVLDVNLAVYYNKFNGLVVSVSTPVPITVSATGFDGVPQNAGAANSKGIELESRLKVTQSFNLTANVAWSDLEVTKVLSNTNGVVTNIAGSFLKPYSLAPKVQGNLGAEYYVPAGFGNQLRFFVNDAYRTAEGINSANGAETSGVGLVSKNPLTNAAYISASMSNLSAGVTFLSADKKWRVDFTGHNLFDERRPVATIAAVPNLFGAIQQWNEPLNWNLGLTRTF